jgi:hypothetical protein
MIEKSARLIKQLREELGSITLEDVKRLDDPQLTDAEMTARAGEAELFYIHHMENILDALNFEQLHKIGEQGTTPEVIQFQRGTLNGIYLIKEWFKNQLNISRARFTPEEKPEKGEVI